MNQDSRAYPKSKQRGGNQKRDNAEARPEILPYNAAGRTAKPNGKWESFKVVCHQSDVGSLELYIRPRSTHGDPDSGIGHCRCVIHTVTDHGDAAAFFE